MLIINVVLGQVTKLTFSPLFRVLICFDPPFYRHPPTPNFAVEDRNVKMVQIVEVRAKRAAKFGMTVKMR